MNREIWEGWTVQKFIDELAPQLDLIMQGLSWCGQGRSLRSGRRTISRITRNQFLKWFSSLRTATE